MHVKGTYLKTVSRHFLIWTFAFLLLRFIRKFGDESNDKIAQIDSAGTLKTIILFIVIGFISGLLFGTYEYLFNKYFTRKRSFGLTVFWGALGYLIIIVSFLIVVFLFSDLFFKIRLGIADFKEYIIKGGGLVAIVYCLIIGFIIEFVKQVDKKFGPGNLRKMILGKFYEPKEENRIFMFLDMRSSTTIAEQMGHQKFCRLVQDCFKDIDVVIPFKAEIYQYVGDEVVLTWEKEKGLENDNCIFAFFAFLDKLKEREAYYEKNYGLLPVFKAGINIGNVMVAEVGEIKREISYYGDTLNTAARIQSKCNEYKSDFLASGKLVEKLPRIRKYFINEMKEIKLKGKNEVTKIYSIRRK